MARAAKAEVSTIAVNDVTTPAGFLAEYDLLASELNKVHGWCDDGTRYPYDPEVARDDEDKQVFTSPRDRKPGTTRMDDDCYTEKGLALIKAQEAEQLPRYQQAAMNAILYGLKNGNLTVDEAKLAGGRLGLPEVTIVAGYQNGFNVYGYVTTDTALTAAQGRTIQAAIKEAITAALTSDTSHASSVTTDVSRGTRTRNTVKFDDKHQAEAYG